MFSVVNDCQPAWPGLLSLPSSSPVAASGDASAFPGSHGQGDFRIASGSSPGLGRRSLPAVGMVLCNTNASGRTACRIQRKAGLRLFIVTQRAEECFLQHQRRAWHLPVVRRLPDRRVVVVRCRRLAREARSGLVGRYRSADRLISPNTVALLRRAVPAAATSFDEFMPVNHPARASRSRYHVTGYRRLLGGLACCPAAKPARPLLAWCQPRLSLRRAPTVTL